MPPKKCSAATLARKAASKTTVKKKAKENSPTAIAKQESATTTSTASSDHTADGCDGPSPSVHHHNHATVNDDEGDKLTNTGTPKSNPPAAVSDDNDSSDHSAIHWEQQNFSNAWIRITPPHLSDAIEKAFQSFLLSRSSGKKPPKVTAPYEAGQIVCYFTGDSFAYSRPVGNADHVDSRNIRRVAVSSPGGISTTEICQSFKRK